MANLDFPVKPGSILEFECNGVTVRGEVSSVTFYNNNLADCFIYDGDVFTRYCSRCTLNHKTKCKFCNGLICTLSEELPLELESIKAEEIGKKYRIVRKSWNDSNTKDGE